MNSGLGRVSWEEGEGRMGRAELLDTAGPVRAKDSSVKFPFLSTHLSFFNLLYWMSEQSLRLLNKIRLSMAWLKQMWQEEMEKAGRLGNHVQFYEKSVI